MSLKQIILLTMLSLGLVTSLGSYSDVLGQSGATSSSITGVVTDEQGAVIAGAKVVVQNIGTNLIRETLTNEEGVYNFLQLAPSVYQVTVEVEGFKTSTAKIDLELGTSVKINVGLQIKTGNEIVEVVAGSTLVQEGKTESSINQDGTRIKGLPINRRNFLDFSLTTPRVVLDRAPAQGFTSNSGISFNGQSGRRNNISIDGVDNNETASGAVRATFSQDAVQEFQVISDTYSAEFGRALGGVVNIVTKTGTNEYHGSLFFIDRNDKISSRDVFAPFKPPFSQYQVGSILSGPIKKDTAFFFASFERLSLKQNNFVTITDRTVDAIRRQGFSIRNGPVPFGIGTTTALVKGDVKLSSNDNLAIRYNYGRIYDGRYEPFGGLFAETSTNVNRQTDQALVLTNTHISTKLNLVNETRFQFATRDLDVRGLEKGPQVQLIAPEGAVTFGPSVSSQPFLGETKIYQLVDNVSLIRGKHQIKTGFDFIYQDFQGFLLPFSNGLAVFLPVDFSVVAGIPGLPFFTGLETFDPAARTPAQLAFLNLLSGIAPAMFPGFPSGVPLADLPLPSAYIQGFGSGNYKVFTKEFSTYVQDDIKIKQNLTLKLGLRYDIQRATAFPKNNGNFSPRVAIAYNPAKFNKLQLRAAYGLFFARLLVGQSIPVQLSVPETIKIGVNLAPFAVLPFARPGRSYLDNSQYPADLPFIRQQAIEFEFNQKLRNSYSQQLTAGFDYYISKNTAFSASYAFVRGLRLYQERNVNPIVRPAESFFGRIDPTRGNVTQFASDGDSYYHALTLGVERRFAKDFNFLAHYTFSKGIDNFFDIRIDLTNGPVDPLNVAAERGFSAQDVRHRFVGSGTWDINYSKNILLKDYQVSAILNISSGSPFNLIAGADLNGNGDNPPSDRPLIGNTPIGRNTGVLPGFASLDLRFKRTLSIKETFSIEGFIEGFNVLNRTNISQVNNVYPFNPVTRNFGLPPSTGQNGRFEATPDRFTGAFSPRQLQFGVRLSF